MVSFLQYLGKRNNYMTQITYMIPLFHDFGYGQGALSRFGDRHYPRNQTEVGPDTIETVCRYVCYGQTTRNSFYNIPRGV